MKKRKRRKKEVTAKVLEQCEQVGRQLVGAIGRGIVGYRPQEVEEPPDFSTDRRRIIEAYSSQTS